MAAVLDNVDCVIACAGITWARNEADYHAVNVEGTRRMVEAALAAGVKRFVYVSSLAAQGPSPDGKPHPEQAAPVTAYGRSKRGGELPVLAAKDAMSVAVLRPPVIYGPRDVNMMPAYRAIRWLHAAPVYGDGTNLLSFVHVHDCADAAVRVAMASTPPGAIYSVSDGALHTWRDVALTYGSVIDRRPVIINVPPLLYRGAGRVFGTITRLTGLTMPMDSEMAVEMQQRYWVCDNEAITRDLGWQPQYDLESGMAQTQAWYTQHGWH
jgi:nucleoside-diphosphate-sugar epimerase